MPETEIRRIREDEAEQAVELWDRMCRAVPDGGPLTAQGRRNLRRMLESAAWHLQTCCLVAVREGEVLGFAVTRVDAGDGLLPGAVGLVEEVYAVPGEEAVRRRLAEAAVERLRAGGATTWTLRKLAAADDEAEQRFWRDLGFVPDMVVMSSYADG